MWLRTDCKSAQYELKKNYRKVSPEVDEEILADEMIEKNNLPSLRNLEGFVLVVNDYFLYYHF